MDRLSDGLELLDGPLDDHPTLAGNLRDLRRINRWLGGASLSGPAIDALAAHRREVTLLDVGTGGADIPLDLLERAADRSRGLTVVAIDSRPEVLAAAVRARPAVATTAGLQLHVGDGRSLPYADRSFDVAHASMVVHHLEPDEAVGMLREMGRVARLGVVVNEVDRTRTGAVGAWLMGHLLTSNRYTRHDAVLSVRRSYRAPEMAAMLRRAGLTPVRVVRGAFGLRYAIAALPTPDRIDDANEPPDPRGAGE